MPVLPRRTMRRLTDTIDSVLKQKGGEIWSVSPDQSVYEAIEKMADKGVGALLVISEGALVGVVSERDYARKVILKGKSSKETSRCEMYDGSPPQQVRRIHTANVYHPKRKQRCHRQNAEPGNDPVHDDHELCPLPRGRDEHRH